MPSSTSLLRLVPWVLPRGAVLKGRRALTAACGAVVLIYFLGLGSIPLFDPDEGRYAEIPREMLANHDLVTPRLNGVLYFEKPPLYYWLNAAAIEALGPSEIAIRIWNAMLALLGIAGTFLLGRTLFGARAGLLGAGILASLPLFLALAHVNSIDMTLGLTLFWTMTAFWFAHLQPPGRGRTLLWCGMFTGAALTVLAKGLIGIVFPGAIVFFYLLATRRFRVLAEVPWLRGIALFLAIALPWHVLMAQRHPDFLYFYFVHEHFLRYSTGEARRQGPIYYFVVTLVLGALPWTALLPGLFRRPAATAASSAPSEPSGRRPGEPAERIRWRDRPARQPALTFLWIWFGFILFFFSVSQSKLIPYILPALPPFALLLGIAAESLLASGRRLAPWESVAFAAAWLLTTLPGLLLVAASQPIGARLIPEGRFYPGFLLPGIAILAVSLLLIPLVIRGPWPRRLIACFVLACTLSAALIHCARFVGDDRTSRNLARAIQARLEPDAPLYSFRDFPEGLPFYLGRTLGVVQYQGELAFGIAHLSAADRLARYPTSAEFRARWDSPRAIYLVATQKTLRRLETDGLLHARSLWQGGKYVLLSNQGVRAGAS